MRHLLIILVYISFAHSASSQSFSFKATINQDFTVGVVNDHGSPLKYPIIVSFKNNTLSAVRSDGKKYMTDVTVKKIIPFRKASQRGAIEEYFIEYIDEAGLTVYATYKKYSAVATTKAIESLTIPIIMEDKYYAFSYTELVSE